MWQDVEMWKQFRRGDVTYLAISKVTGDGVRIVDSEGNNYGAYWSIESFDEMAQETLQERTAAGVETQDRLHLSLGKCRLSVQIMDLD